MKKICLAFFAMLCSFSAFALDFKVSSTRVLETLTSDEIFIAQTANQSEMLLVLEKGYKDSFGEENPTYRRPKMDFEKKVEDIINKMETKKQYDENFAKALKAKDYCVFDHNHSDFTYDQIIEIINTFKPRLAKEKAAYYIAFMRNGNSSNYYIFVYDIAKKKIYMEETNGYIQSWTDERVNSDGYIDYRYLN